MELRRFLTLATLVVPVLSSPIVSFGALEDETLSYNPGGPLHTATETPMPVNPGGPVRWPTGTETDNALSFNPGGPLIPDSTPAPTSRNPPDHSSEPPNSDTPLPFNPGGPMTPASPPSIAPTPTPMPINPGGPERPPSKRIDTPLAALHLREVKSLPPPPPPPPFGLPFGPPPPPPKFLTSAALPPIGFAPGCRRSHHRTRSFPFQAVETQTPSPQLPPDQLLGQPAMPRITPSPAQPIPRAKGCTTTVTQPTPSNPCAWDGTQTLYPSTTTMYQGIDCHGCTALSVSRHIYFCPNHVWNDTTRASTPSTYWSTVCMPMTPSGQAIESQVPAVSQTIADAPPQHPTITSPLRQYDERQSQDTGEDAPGEHENWFGGGADGCVCPTTLIVRPPQTAGRTSTCYERYTTTTVSVDCEGCPLVISTALFGFGPIARFTKTTTLPLGTATAYACG